MQSAVFRWSTVAVENIDLRSWLQAPKIRKAYFWVSHGGVTSRTVSDSLTLFLLFTPKQKGRLWLAVHGALGSSPASSLKGLKKPVKRITEVLGLSKMVAAVVNLDNGP